MQSWAAFRDDPDWQRVKSRTEEGGSLTKKVEIALPRTDRASAR